MVQLNLYRVRDSVASHYGFQWNETEPTVCPIEGNALLSTATSITNSIDFGSSFATYTSTPLTVTASSPRIFYLNTASNSIVINLPAVIEGFSLFFKKTSATNTVTINRNGSDTINGAASSVTISALNGVIYMTGSGTDWTYDNDAFNYEVASIEGTLTVDGGINATINTASQPNIDHNSLTNLTASDVHTQYSILAGRAGGQTLTGGTAASNNLILRSTSNATKGIVSIDETTASSSTTTGALVVGGGVGVAGNTNVGGNLAVTGTVTSTGTISGTIATATQGTINHNSLANLTTGDVHTQYSILAGRSGGQTLTGGTAASNSLVLRSTSNATKGIVSIDETTASSSSTTGALVVGGGVGVAGNTNVGGNLAVTGTITSTGTISGTIATATQATIDHNSLANTATGDVHTQYSILAGRAGGQTITGGTAASNNLVLRSSSNATKGQVYVDETTASSSTTTGALRVGGGVGVAGNLNVGGTITSTGTISGTIATATQGTVDHNSLANLTTGDVHTQYSILAGRAGGQTITGGTAASNNLVLRSSSNATKGSVSIDETTASSSTTTGALVVGGGVGIAGAANVGGNLAVAGTITSTGTISGTIATATQGTINHNSLANLTTGDVHTQYSILAGRAGGQTLTGGTAASNNLVLRSSSNATKGIVSIDETTTSSSTTTGALVVGGGVGVAGNLNVGGTISGTIATATQGTVDHNSLANLTTGDVHTQYSLLSGRSGGQTITGGTAASNSLVLRSTSNATKGVVSIDETTASSSTTTGALVVGGGVGIAGNANVGGNLAVTGTITSTGTISGTIATATQATINHNSLANNAVGDVHTQYSILAGRAGGQTITGGTAASNSLVLRSTSNATKGQVYLDETTASTSTITGALRIDGGLGIGGAVWAGTLNGTLGTLTGALPIANGGTGQVTATDAFTALSPLTTKGDLVVYGTTNTRLPVGTDGQILLADSTQALGVKWGTAPSTLALSGTTDPGNSHLYVEQTTGGDPATRVFFNSGTLATSGYMEYAYNGFNPYFRIVDMDDDIPFVSFETVNYPTGTLAAPVFVNTFGTRGPNAGGTTGFSWKTNAGVSGGAMSEIMSADSNFLAIPSRTTANRPGAPSNGMIGYNSTTTKFEAYETGNWMNFITGRSTDYVGVTATFTTTSATAVLITSTVLTPPAAGVYLVFFTGHISNNTASTTNTFAIHNNGTQVADSVRTTLGAANERSNVSIITLVTYTTGDIDVRAFRSGGTLTVRERSLLLLRIA